MVIALTVVGITVEAVIPLDEPVKAIYPIASYAGLAIFVRLIVTDIRSRKVQLRPGQVFRRIRTGKQELCTPLPISLEAGYKLSG